MGKRGVSYVVVLVLIILISIVSLGFAWTYILGTIGDTGEKLSTDCFELDLQAVSCQADNDEVLVAVEKKSGTADLIDIRFIFTGDNGQSVLRVEDVLSGRIPGILERRFFRFTNNGYRTVDVAGVIGNVLCPQSNVVISCDSVDEIPDIEEEMQDVMCGTLGDGCPIGCTSTNGSNYDPDCPLTCQNPGDPGCPVDMPDETQELCDLPGDRGNLYNTNTTIFMQNGVESFSIRRSDGVELRRSFNNEIFYQLNEAGLNVTYDIVESCGGVDINYQVRNPTSSSKKLPEFRIEGIVQDDRNVDFLFTNGYGNMVPLVYSSGSFNNVFYDKFKSSFYPGPQLYSPVIVTKDPEFSVGSSLEYPYLDYKHAVYMDPTLVQSGNKAGTWTHRYHTLKDENGGVNAIVDIPAGQTWSYTLSLRFAPDNKWIYTLYPYKQFFQSEYDRDITPKDLRPVRIIGFSVPEAINGSNPRGYRDNRRVDIEGWGPILTPIIENSGDLGYKRILIAGPGGAFSGASSAFNFAPQFASDWLPVVDQTAGQLSMFQSAGMKFGFLWGHSGDVPVPVQWNPSSLDPVRLSNPSHHQFLRDEFAAARARGVKSLEMDAWQSMYAYDRYSWINEMKGIDSSIQIVHQGTGADFLHAQVANVYWPENNYPDDVLPGPDVLSWYLNPGAEVQVYVTQDSNPDSSYIQQLIRWGYTPKIAVGIGTDVSNMVLSEDDLSQLFN